MDLNKLDELVNTLTIVQIELLYECLKNSDLDNADAFKLVERRFLERINKATETNTVRLVGRPVL